MSKHIEVVFVKDLENVGRVGEKKPVSVGFWRNHLLPRGLAVFATDSRAKSLIKKRQEVEEREKSTQNQAQAAGEKQHEMKKAVRTTRKEERREKERSEAEKLKKRVS